MVKNLTIPRELPEPVLTSDMMPHFEDVAMIPNPGERAEAMRQLIDRLPTANRLLVQYMFKHMGHIIARVRVAGNFFLFYVELCSHHEIISGGRTALVMPRNCVILKK